MPLAGAAYVGLGKVWREWNDLAQAAAHLARRIEHVAAPLGGPSRRLQDWLEPLWCILSDGCHPNRETWVALEQAGFEQVKKTIESRGGIIRLESTEGNGACFCFTWPWGSEAGTGR